MNIALRRDKTKAPTVPGAYRAWAYWVNVCNGGGFQVVQVRAADLPTEHNHLCLCEVYARATFETVLGLHFDSMDSHADDHVLNQIAELYSHELALSVREAVAARGPIVARK